MAEQEASSRIPSARLYWRVRACRWLWRGLAFVWGTLIVGIAIATIANLNTTTTDTPLSKLYIIHLAQTYRFPVWSSLGLLVLLTLLSWLGSRERQTALPHSLSKQDRSHMLRRLRLYYEQLLSQSLQGAVQLELGLTQKPAAVQHALGLALRLPDQPEQPLPSHTSIVQAYELAQQELLILGEPGAGKSTLLVELAHFLVEQAEQDISWPLPVLLPLSSWAEHKRPLDKWLSEETARLYDVPYRLSQQWIAADQVLPLLDGLDEMEEAARPSCIAAINIYHRDHLRPLVVCSRTREYDAATRHEQLVLHTAVVVQPLSEKQVDSYLISLGKPLEALCGALRKSMELRELATTPLMLQVLMLTYHGTSVRALSQQEAPVQEQIWTDYVQRMVRGKGNVQRYPLSVTTSWLRWLASEMRQHNQAIFSLESLQPDWLPASRRKWYRWNAGLAAGLADSIKPAEILTWPWKKFGTQLLAMLLVELTVGLVVGLVAVLVGGLAVRLTAVLTVGLAIGLTVGLAFVFSTEQLTERLVLSPNEGIHRSLKNGLLFGLLFGPVTGLFFGLDAGLVVGLVTGLVGGLAVGLAGGLGAALQHYMLRFWLAQSSLFPRRAVPFLEDATARILLRRVGGGYSFAHRLLLDYFADLGTQTPLAQEAAQTKSTLVQTKASASAEES